MFDRILVPTDGSWGSRGAVETAVSMAADYDATLHALYVVDEDVYRAYSGDEYVHEHEGLEEGLEEVGEEAVAEVADYAAEAGVAVVTELRHGVPDETILDYVDDHDVDLTVMGTKERPDEYRRFIGSVTQRVAQASSEPVMIVKSREDE